MTPLLSDENCFGPVVAGVLREHPEVDLVRAQDAGLSGVDDPDVLEWAAVHGRVLLTNDKRTMIGFAMRRIEQGVPMAGVILLRPDTSLSAAIEWVAMVGLATDPPDWNNRIEWIPLS